MYLMNSIHEDKQVGVYPYNSILTDKVQALKYTIAEVKKDNIISKKVKNSMDMNSITQKF